MGKLIAAITASGLQLNHFSLLVCTFLTLVLAEVNVYTRIQIHNFSFRSTKSRLLMEVCKKFVPLPQTSHLDPLSMFCLVLGTRFRYRIGLMCQSVCFPAMQMLFLPLCVCCDTLMAEMQL